MLLVRLTWFAVGFFLASSAPVLAQNGGGARPAQIDRNGVLVLVRSSLLALDHANKTGNYTVLRELGSPQFQLNTDARLAEIFAPQRRDNLDLSGVAALDPQLTLMPQIEPNGMMRIKGFFPSIPAQINFELLYAPVDGRWRLFGLSIGLASSAPAAPPPAVSKPAGSQPAASKPATPAKPPAR